MIIHLAGGTAEDREAAVHDLTTLASDWGHEVTAGPVPPRTNRDDKALDPVALAALVVSLPSAALAVADLADRLRKRRRARQLIDHARRLADRRISVVLITRQLPVEIATLDPDRLLDLMAEEDPDA